MTATEILQLVGAFGIGAIITTVLTLTANRGNRNAAAAKTWAEAAHTQVEGFAQLLEQQTAALANEKAAHDQTKKDLLWLEDVINTEGSSETRAAVDRARRVRQQLALLRPRENRNLAERQDDEARERQNN